MASRNSSRARPPKQAEDQEDRGRLVGISRRNSVSSGQTKIPTSSWFSRSKERKREVKTSASRPTTADQDPARTSSRRKDESTASGKTHSSRSLGLGLSALKPSSHASKSEFEHRERNVLRRKVAPREFRSGYPMTESTVSSYDERRTAKSHDAASSMVRETQKMSSPEYDYTSPLLPALSSFIPASNVVHPEATSSSRMESYNNNRGKQNDSPQLVPPTMSYSSGSSTRRSESPGAFSRTSTPTSMSSVSPAMPLPSKTSLKPRQQSPARSRPPVTRHKYAVAQAKTPGLAPVKESGTSSSSSSTVRGPERIESNRGHRLSPPPPSPPFPGTAAQEAIRLYDATRIRSPSSQRGSLDEQRQSGEIMRSRSRGPPARPSRENTPKLDECLEPSPVIRSNLTRLATTGHWRRESPDRPRVSLDAVRDSNRQNVARATANRTPPTTSTSSRLPSPNPTAASSRSGETSRNKDVVASTTLSSSGRSKKDPSPTSASSTTSSSRFGLFSRKLRSPLENATPSESVEKSSKKGPAAGTGHEGYGKYARRGRSGSVNSSASRGRSTSTTGTATSGRRTPSTRKNSVSEPEMDDFLLQRLAPVVISGGAVTDNRNSRDFYRTSMDSMVSLTSTAAGSAYSAYSTQAFEPALTTSVVSSGSHRLRRESRNLPADHHYIKDPSTGANRPTLAARRSLHRSQLLKEAEPLKVPDPINVGVAAPSAMSSRDTLPTSALASDDYSEGREGNWLKSSRKSKKQDPSPKKRNFFQRVLASPKKPPAPVRSARQEPERKLPATITRLPESRTVPYYAIMDTLSQSDSDPADFASQNPRQSRAAEEPRASSGFDKGSRIDHRKQSMLLPSPPSLMTGFSSTSSLGSARALMHQPETIPVDRALSPKAQSDPRQLKTSRLQQVGRIPRVISKRDRLHNPPPQSFSRPFASGPSSRKVSFSEASEAGSIEAMAPPVLDIQTERLQSGPWVDENSASPSSAPIPLGFDPNPVQRPDFLSFPPQQYSQMSASSSSGAASFAANPASQPDMSTAPQDDEVWNEYNAFIDHVEKSSTPSPERKTPKDKSRDGSKGKHKAMVPAPLSLNKEQRSRSQRGSPTKPHPAPLHPPPQSDLPAPPSLSKLLDATPPGEASLTPLSITSFLAGYADRNRISQLSKRYSDTSGSHYSIDDVPLDIDPALAKRNTQIMVEKTSQVPGPHSNLRFKALMTSRWLSFGRVLFSPAHHEIQANRQDRILVLDGLANDDWSYYCALSYPNATFYNLSPLRRSSTSKREADTYPSPSNHRQIYHAGISHPFPFPKGFFTAVVFRFPVASPETAYTAAIRECKRVLRPGGYLELSILDIDMVNMGNRTRRAVRGLKVRTQQADPAVSLKPLSDSFQRMLGRRGFEGLQRCIVDVPVAGYIASSNANSPHDEEERERDLGEILKDDSSKGDEDITKMVSKVGRWWYSRCYEAGQRGGSIWDEEGVLKECEKRETGLKLLICHAQKPEASKRRTASM